MLLLVAAACGGDADDSAAGATTAAPPTSAAVPTTTMALDATSAPAATTAPAATSAPTDGCADVIDAAARPGDDGTMSFDVTVRSADTGDEKYADAWQVETLEGDVLGVRELLHPHVNEQPFTRSLGPIEIPAGVTEVRIVARDSVLGFCGEAFVLELPS